MAWQPPPRRWWVTRGSKSHSRGHVRYRGKQTRLESRRKTERTLFRIKNVSCVAQSEPGWRRPTCRLVGGQDTTGCQVTVCRHHDTSVLYCWYVRASGTCLRRLCVPPGLTVCHTRMHGNHTDWASAAETGVTSPGRAGASRTVQYRC